MKTSICCSLMKFDYNSYTSLSITNMECQGQVKHHKPPSCPCKYNQHTKIGYKALKKTNNIMFLSFMRIQQQTMNAIADLLMIYLTYMQQHPQVMYPTMWNQTINPCVEAWNMHCQMPSRNCVWGCLPNDQINQNEDKQ